MFMIYVITNSTRLLPAKFHQSSSWKWTVNMARQV